MSKTYLIRMQTVDISLQIIVFFLFRRLNTKQLYRNETPQLVLWSYHTSRCRKTTCQQTRRYEIFDSDNNT